MKWSARRHVVLVAALSVWMMPTVSPAVAAPGPERPKVLAYVRVQVAKNARWSWSCKSNSAKSMFMGYVYSYRDAGVMAGQGPSFRSSSLLRLKTATVDQQIVSRETPQDYPFGSGMGTGDVARKAGKLTVAWGVWGGDARCLFTLNGKKVSVKRLSASRGGHLGAEAMSPAVLAQSPNGEFAVGSHYSWNNTGVLFGWLLYGSGQATITDPSGQSARYVGVEQAPYPGLDPTGAIVWGVPGRGKWSFDVPLGFSEQGAHLWVIDVP